MTYPILYKAVSIDLISVGKIPVSEDVFSKNSYSILMSLFLNINTKIYHENVLNK